MVATDHKSLWTGAEVRWIGRERTREGVHIRPGDRAEVVDAGRYRLQSFGVLGTPASGRRARRGVLIRLPSGEVMDVPRKHLKVVLPEHPLVPDPDSSEATSLVDRLERTTSGARVPVAAFVPRSYPAVARVLHPWADEEDPMREPVPWWGVAASAGISRPRELELTRDPGGFLRVEGFRRPARGNLHEETLRPLVETLGAATSTPQSVTFAVWEGWGDVPPQRFDGAGRVLAHGERYALFRGPLEGALVSIAIAPVRRFGGALWWPADEAWLVASPIDLEWTFVAGSEALIGQLLDRRGVEATRTSPDAPAATPDDTGSL